MEAILKFKLNIIIINPSSAISCKNNENLFKKKRKSKIKKQVKTNTKSRDELKI